MDFDLLSSHAAHEVLQNLVLLTGRKIFLFAIVGRLSSLGTLAGTTSTPQSYSDETDQLTITSTLKVVKASS